MRGLWAIALLFVGAAGAAAQSKPNVLFIAVDDLNHWVGHFGRNPQTKTPNIDALAARGVTFTHAYCAPPLCNPSRAALLSGIRPHTSGVYDNETDYRPHLAPELCLNDVFRKAGYKVLGAGKIYHESFSRDSDWDDRYRGKGKVKELAPIGSPGVGGIRFGPCEGRDEDVPDFAITNWVIEQLGRKHDKPFFLACGLHKPHMPWYVPKKYYDMFPLESIQLPPIREDDLNDIPSAGVKMAKPQGDHADIVKSGRWREAIQGYLAAIAYTDMNIGRLIAAFDKSAYKDNTLIVLWSDHGWHLGEKQHWRKFTLWEEATRNPLIFVVPGLTKPKGVCVRPVDLMCVYPTLCELCDIPIPKHVEGVSVKPLLSNPAAAWDKPALTTYLFNNHSVRAEGWRYIRYADGSEELYDSAKDAYEWTNLAGNPEYAAKKAELAKFIPQNNKPSANVKKKVND